MDARIVDHQAKTLTTLEMSCPWIQYREKKDEEKVLKYGPLRWELKKQFKGYRIPQCNIIIDVLGGWSSSTEVFLGQLLGNMCKEVLKRMQRSTISSSLNIVRTFKVIGTWYKPHVNHEGHVYTFLFGRGPNRVMETACFDANVQ